MPGSAIYDEYPERGRMFSELSWNHYRGDSVVFKHPSMEPEEMIELYYRILQEGFSMGRILSRTVHTVKNRPSAQVGLNSFFTQVGIRKAIRQQYNQKRSCHV
ncbi:MAG: hypothetical protein ACE5HX_14355 [bacterium]